MSTDPSGGQFAAACRRLFEPLSMERFFAERWPSRYFLDHPRPQRRAALEVLLGGANLDELFAAHEPVGAAHVFTQREGSLAGAAELGEAAAMVEELVAPRWARERTAEANVLLKKMHQALPSLGACVRLIERLCGLSAGSCDSHVHVSGPGAGFVVHFDDKDVITFQVRGTKTWWVGEHPFIEGAPADYVPGETPSPELADRWPAGVPFDGSYRPSDRDLTRIELTPGSMLFLPRGHWHRTRAQELSLSLTFGFHTRARTDGARGAGDRRAPS